MTRRIVSDLRCKFRYGRSPEAWGCDQTWRRRKQTGGRISIWFLNRRSGVRTSPASPVNSGICRLRLTVGPQTPSSVRVAQHIRR